MSRIEKLISKIIRGSSDANIRFDEIVHLLDYLGFDERTKGSHHIFRKLGVIEKLVLQKDGNKAKCYQVKQVRRIIIKNHLGKKYE